MRLREQTIAPYNMILYLLESANDFDGSARSWHSGQCLYVEFNKGYQPTIADCVHEAVHLKQYIAANIGELPQFSAEAEAYLVTYLTELLISWVLPQ
jgi:hypothetical protein